ncbi:hypothetical protein [Methylorubrum populi]|uniref:hypothetical protein n=1 Tax=Methylorubrum populi TaxID=223967 RepID=UPI0023573AF8|nr:hypothetical protein [Methylorubrum populi]
MSDRNYPQLPEGLGLKLRAIETNCEFDPGYLLDDACPYPDDVKAYLRRLVAPAQAGRPDTVDAVFEEGMSGDEETDSLIKEIQNAINSMKLLQRDIDSSDDVGDRLAFLKNYGSLIDRFLALKERTQGIKQMYEFQRIVIQAMEQLLDKDGRLDFKNRLREANVGLT